MYKIILTIIKAGFMLTIPLAAQITEHGDVLNRARNDHAGNLIRVTYHNHGMLGSIRNDNSLVYGGEWPINSGLVQMGNASSFVCSEIFVYSHQDSASGDSVYLPITPCVFSQGWDPLRFSSDSLGNFLGFEPLPGFHNPDNPDQFHKSAMSHMPITWPLGWPDKQSDATDPGWRGAWNGYFGKNIFNADQESYHVNDDYQFKKKINNLSISPPIAMQPDRGGLGLKKFIRGLQWSNPDAEDCIFWIYSIENIGELQLRKTNFGLNVGASIGAIIGRNSDWLDDAATFYRETDLTVNFDWDNIGTGGYTPVPWVGFAFLESPGNPFDAIDNDADGSNGNGKLITVADFERFVAIGEDIVLIDYESDTYERTIIPMPDTGITFVHNGFKYKKLPNVPLIENPRNGIDDNLNGIIDESDGAEITETGETFFLYIRDATGHGNNQDYLARDYISGVGLDNLMIDERRDDGIDNDGDWDPLTDDVGLDGAEATGDEGEGDGIPTPGRDGLPGENNIDRVDVSESDQIGLTSFIFYEYGTVTYSDDNQMWSVTLPGYFDGHLENVDADYIFSTGYFPLMTGQIEAFSVGMIYGWDEQDILRNKDIVQVIYNANYNFAVAPKPPTVWAVPGDNKVTIYWDDESEASKDRFLKEYDFEGYKIYRATDPGFIDAGAITDGYGYERYKQPLAVFDKIDGVSGFHPLTGGTGVQYYMGNESGLVHTYVDSPVVNGRRYFYAVGAFDKGSLDFNIIPTENSKFVTIDQTGEITTGSNVVVVIPSAPVLGYIPPEFDNKPQRVGGEIEGSGEIYVRFIEPEMFSKNQSFELRFLDKSMDGIDNDGDGLIDLDDPDEALPTETTGFALFNRIDEFNPEILDTVWIYDKRHLDDTTFVTIKNLYNDDDKNPRTFTASTMGMEFFVYNPKQSILSKDNETGPDIIDGVLWGESIDPLMTYNISFELWSNPAFEPGTFAPRQFMIVFNDELIHTSSELVLTRLNGTKKTIKPIESNFKVYDILTNTEMKYGFFENWPPAFSLAPPNHFSAKDEIYFFEQINDTTKIATFHLIVNDVTDQDFLDNYGRTLGTGDTLYLYTDSPYTASDRFWFSVSPQRVDNAVAKASLDKIKVVPNPYVVTNTFEPRNPYTNGRGPRKLYFNHLPQRCTIRIFTVDGTLVDIIEHDSNIMNGSAEWDLLTRDNMDVAYGLYIYHVEAPGLGQKVGRFILIK